MLTAVFTRSLYEGGVRVRGSTDFALKSHGFADFVLNFCGLTDLSIVAERGSIMIFASVSGL